MNTHRRAWILRAGVVAAMAMAGLVATSGPAHAVDPSIQYTLSTGSIKAGQSAGLRFKITNNNVSTPPGTDTATVKVSLTLNEVTCEGDKCDFTQPIDRGATSDEFTVALKASASIPAGETKQGKVRITADLGGGDSVTVERDITARGPDLPQVQTVTEVSGLVKDVFTGAPLENAIVYLQDSANPPHNYNTSTDRSGRYKFIGTAERPITPGILAIQAAKDGYKEYNRTATGVAGQALTTQTLSMTSLTPASATPSPGASGPSIDEQAPISEGAPLGGLSPNEEEGGGLSFVLIAIGGLLVLLGIGAIILLFIRKRHEDDEDEHEGATLGPPQRDRGGRVPPPRGGRPPPRRGAPDPTAPMRRAEMAGAGDPTAMMRRPEPGGHPAGPRDATMIARSPLADAPTMLHGRLPAEHADPYTSPVRPGPGGAQPPYGGPGYGSPAGTNGYSSPAGYGPGPAAAPVNGYGPAGGGYGADPGYGPADSYGGRGDRSGYGGNGGYHGEGGYGDPGYGAPGGYGPSSPASGYGPSSPAGGYGPPASPPSGYGPASPAGPPGPPSYGEPGYGEPAYGEPGYGGQGWDQQRGGGSGGTYDPAYDEYDRGPSRPRPGNDRRLDWMDD